MQDFILKQIQSSCDIKNKILQDKEIINLIQNISEQAVKLYKAGNKILIAGNGGSAADAQHIAGELVGRFYFDRPGLPAIALTTDSSILTGIGNDYGYKNLFARQIQAQGKEGDMFVAISTSGNSPNIVEAIHESKKNKVITVGLTGESGGVMGEICNYCIKVPSNDTPRIQESHIMIGHIICSIIEQEIFGKAVNLLNNIDLTSKVILTKYDSII